MKRKPYGVLAMRDPYWIRPVLAEDFSLLTRRQERDRVRKSGRRPLKIIH
jgi:hypothetical protein